MLERNRKGRAEKWRGLAGGGGGGGKGGLVHAAPTCKTGSVQPSAKLICTGD